MLQFNFNRLFKAKGIDKPTSYLIRNGYSDNFATKVVHNNFRRLNLDDVERLCELLSCTPNDMLQWIPDKDADLTTHPLAPILHTEKVMDLSRTLNSVPFSKLLEIEKIIQSEVNKE
jgi:DNA-binding Xre family transcriptional regulator